MREKLFIALYNYFTVVRLLSGRGRDTRKLRLYYFDTPKPLERGESVKCTLV